MSEEKHDLDIESEIAKRSETGEQVIEENQDWKETKLIEYAALEHEIAEIACEMTEDDSLHELIMERNRVDKAITALKSIYTLVIEAKEQTQKDIKTELLAKWDIKDKTVKYDAGKATIRTKKLLVVDKKAELLLRLKDILGDEAEAVECIQTFDLPRVGKYKDADLINDEIAHYDEKKSVAISVKESEQ